MASFGPIRKVTSQFLALLCFFSSPIFKMPNSGARSSTPGRSHYEEAGSHLEYVELLFSAIPSLPRDSFCTPVRYCALRRGLRGCEWRAGSTRRLTRSFSAVRKRLMVCSETTSTCSPTLDSTWRVRRRVLYEARAPVDRYSLR